MQQPPKAKSATTSKTLTLRVNPQVCIERFWCSETERRHVRVTSAFQKRLDTIFAHAVSVVPTFESTITRLDYIQPERVVCAGIGI